MPTSPPDPVTGWTLAFTVDLSLDVVDTIPPEVAIKIKVPGSYSVSQFLLDFTTANLMSFDRNLSVTPGLEDKPLGQAPERDGALAAFIERYLRSLIKTNHNVLGYAITMPDPFIVNPIAPSFPPTSPEAPGRDCFLFLEMTDKHPFPGTTPYNIGWTWNWIGESPRQSASMVLGKGNFWDAFFVPHVTILNRLALDLSGSVWRELDVSTYNTDDLSSTVLDSGLQWKTKEDKSATWDWSKKKEQQRHTYPVHAHLRHNSRGHP
ncbi:hypothetical protein DFH07DRAFT_781659 [Mycena maculata]|uniref:Uncharacterized protein n=1 Tax=Mycena maculata TaxID=230809 RepID=A0AAD7HYS5_9AGAR|nr:hypothetical protein DFH07DRAFT_781659 [Mycena maculata]